MSGKRLIVGQSEWGVGDQDADGVLKQVRRAMETGAVAELALVDGAGRAVTVFLNGAVAQTVVLDLDRDPRPSEIS